MSRFFSVSLQEASDFIRFMIDGADASTGKDRWITLDANSESEALTLAKQQGVYASKVRLVPDEPSALVDPIMPPDIVVPWYAPEFGLAQIFISIGILVFLGSILVALRLGVVAIFSCMFSGLFMVAIGNVLKNLSETVRCLEKITEILADLKARK